MSTRTLTLDERIIVGELVSAGYPLDRAEGIARMSSDYLALEAQRDTLLAAAKAALPYVQGSIAMDADLTAEQVQAAIAAVESKEQVPA